MTGGKPDVIAVHPDGRKVIYERLCISHRGAALERPAHRQSAGAERPEGAVVYADGSERRISTDSVDDAFVARLTGCHNRLESQVEMSRGVQC